jgi:hypothetical protein
MAANRINRIATRMTAPLPPQNPQQALAVVPPGFAVCPPLVAIAQPWQHEIYRRAYEQARAAAEIPRHHRMLFSVWN